MVGGGGPGFAERRKRTKGLSEGEGEARKRVAEKVREGERVRSTEEERGRERLEKNLQGARYSNTARTIYTPGVHSSLEDLSRSFRNASSRRESAQVFRVRDVKGLRNGSRCIERAPEYRYEGERYM